MRMRVGEMAVIGVATALLTGCGCDAVGYPSVELALRDANTSAAIPVAGAKLYAGPVAGSQPVQVLDSLSVGAGSTYSICCGGGRVFIALDKAGYQRFDTSVVVPTKGRCDVPVLQRVVARLKTIA